MHFGRFLVQLLAALAVNELQPRLAMHFHLSIERLSEKSSAFPDFKRAVVGMGLCKNPAAVNAFQGVQPRLFED
jgi:hypothetical protein